MPRARKRSDALAEKRRKIKRTIASLRKSISRKMVTSERKARRATIRTLERGLKNTYVGRVSNPVLREEAFARAEENLNKLLQTTSIARKNRAGRKAEIERTERLFKNEMRQAMQSNSTIFGSGEVSRVKMKIFWRATQNIWQKPNIPPEKRLDAIKKAYDTDNLFEIFDKVMKNNDKALQYAQKVMDGETIEDDGLSEGGSPDYILLVHVDAIR